MWPARKKNREQRKDRHVTDAKKMREDLTPGRHTGKEGHKRGERMIQIERDRDTKRERE